MNEQIRQKFCLQLGTEQVLFDEPMKKHTTFRIGGPADVFVMPRTIEEVSKALEICRQEQLPYFILGNGSNLLVSDQGYRGVIIQLDRNMEEITVDGTEIRAAAGALLSSIAVAARRASLAGFEFAGGIPGTLGGAVVMNAGAYGGEMKDVLTFKRPEGYFAGKLIMDSGLRGYQIGGARVSDKHCGFVINAGDATAQDVVALMDHVTEVVREKYGVTLEPEVKFLGDFN